MTLLALLTALFAQGDFATIAGTVVDAQGRPLPNTRVFFEPGRAARLVETRTDAAGQFRFHDIAPTTIAGVFAVASGRAYGGTSVNVTIGDRIENLTIRLGQPVEIAGTIENASGRAIPGARLAGIAIAEQEVGIPLAKLDRYGVPQTVSNAEGEFTLGGVPAGTHIHLKVTHPEFAQSGVYNIEAGTRDARVEMSPGVLIRGHVRLRSEDSAVSGARVLIQRAQPPKDSVVAQTRVDGSFNVRLNPGAYFCEVRGGKYRSLNPRRLDVTGQTLTQSLALYVAGAGTLTGAVKNAATGEPVEGARIRLDSFGVPTAVATTGPGGEFSFEVAEGDSVLRLLSAPGHYDPQGRALNFPVEAGQTFEHTFWVVETPQQRVQVIDEAADPVPNAAVRLLRPAQYGWRFADAQGNVDLEIANLPADGVIVGIAEHPSQPHGAMFAIDGKSAETTPVELGPYAKVTGRVVANGDPVAGAIVSGLFTDGEIPERLILFQTVSRQDGAFDWPGAPPNVPIAVVAQSVDASGQVVTSSPASVIADAGAKRNVGEIALTNVESRESLHGQPLNIETFQVLCGDPNALRVNACAVFVASAEAAYAIETLEQLASQIPTFRNRLAVVSDGPVNCNATTIPVLRGAPPGPAHTYVLDAAGRVALETLGLPPLFALVNQRSE